MPSLYSVIIVALGGALGSVFRYLLGTSTQALSKSIDFPYGTLEEAQVKFYRFEP